MEVCCESIILDQIVCTDHESDIYRVTEKLSSSWGVFKGGNISPKVLSILTWESCFIQIAVMHTHKSIFCESHLKYAYFKFTSCLKVLKMFKLF